MQLNVTLAEVFKNLARYKSSQILLNYQNFMQDTRT